MIRHDEHFLQLIHKHVSLDRFQKIQELPFFYLEVPDKWLLTPTQADLDTLLKTLPEEPYDLADILPFNDFSFILSNDPSLHVVTASPQSLLMADYFLPKSYNYSGSPVTKECIESVETADITGYQKKQIDRGVWIHYHGRARTGEYDCLIQQMYRRKQKAEIDLRSFKDNSEARRVFDRNNQDMQALIVTILALFHAAEEKHEHLVKVKKDMTKGINQRGKHHPSRFAARHHYIYLDGPPTETLSKSEASGIKRRGHARRAHWHRLTHDRFKNHPQFGHRIRIKATWVGPKEWADAGKIYTLHEPEDL